MATQDMAHHAIPAMATQDMAHRRWSAMRVYIESAESWSAALRQARAQASVKAVETLLLTGDADIVQICRSESELDALPYWKQGNKSLYDAQVVQVRYELRRHRLVLAALHEWWRAALRSLQSGGDAEACTLSESQYTLLSQRLYAALIPTLDTADALACAASEWQADSKGEAAMGRGLFLDAIFEIADTWCRTAEAEEYATFLDELLPRVATEGPPHARLFWREASAPPGGAAKAPSEQTAAAPEKLSTPSEAAPAAEPAAAQAAGCGDQTTERAHASPPHAAESHVRPRPPSQPSERATPPKRPRGAAGSRRGWVPTGPASSGSGAPWSTISGVVSWQRSGVAA